MDPYATDPPDAGDPSDPSPPDLARTAVDPLLRAAVRTLPEATGAVCAELLGRVRPGRSAGPALVLAAARAVGGFEEDALTAAAAIELVYVMGLLSEDSAGRDPSAPPGSARTGEALAALAIRLVAGRSAAVGVLCDCLVERAETDGEAAGRGALFAAACALGGLHGGASPRVAAALGAFGRAAATTAAASGPGGPGRPGGPPPRLRPRPLAAVPPVGGGRPPGGGSVRSDPALEHLASAVPGPAEAAGLLALYALITRGEL
ncbi:hypothetical protein ACGFXC_01560 [Streptomyces sp. NPDC048507]|uniref:hypothetical protein n=1 Tax=Streptomyces sp. NPDC048507 TaxID=3365560 RepID=UPI00371D6861